VDVDTIELFSALLAVLAFVGAVATVGLRVVARRNESAAAALAGVGQSALWLAFAVAATATAGSLYFSEVANYVPCRLCWFQRIAMYPLAPILLVAAIRKDSAVGWYAGPLAAIGLAVSLYHSVLEWFPSLEGGSCAASGPLCAVPWFETFGFMTLATMAAVGFSTILVLLFVAIPGNRGPAADDLHHDTVEPQATD